MRRITVVLCLAILFGSCRKPKTVASQPSPSSFVTTPAPLVKREWGEARFDVCALLTREEVSEVQGSAITQIKSAGGVDDSLSISQCFYMTATMDVCAVMSLIEKDPAISGGRTPNDLWEQMFGDKQSEAERDGEEAAEESERRRRFPPQRVADMGYEVYWVNGALYALKGAKVLRIAISTADLPDRRLIKVKALAKKALGRM